ncbi:hypothetical protein BGX26_001726 [Mortierella sp. AD094]|nr:hypothetical protein BGX26_001726 [Mortierella sp. AD094]
MMRCCYPILLPIRIILAITTLYCFVAVAIGKKISQDYKSSPSFDLTPALATEGYFNDPAHFGINITVLISAIFTLYRPNSTYWWLSSPFRRMLFALTLATLALNYGIGLFIGILGQHNGCSDSFFANTRSRCVVQYGVSGCETLWAVLIIMEAVITIQQWKDRKWLEQTAEQELRTAVMYRPDLSLETGGGVGHEANQGPHNNNSSNINGGELELTSIAGQQVTNERGVGDEEESLPEYTRRRPRDQPRIIDATHPPERLVGAVARRLQSDEETGGSSSVSQTPQGQATVEIPSEELPPPSYKP